MRSVAVWMVVVGVALGLVGATARVDAGVRGLGVYAVLGLEGVTIGRGGNVESGDVGVNRGEAELKSHATVAGTVAAPLIRLHAHPSVGRLVCALIEGPDRFTCQFLSDPVVDVERLPLMPQVLAGAQAIEVPRDASTAPLPAGAYGAVTVKKHGRLVLAGGDYALRSLTLEKAGTLLCASACQVAVQERVVLKSHAEIAAGAGFDARAVRIDIESGGDQPAFDAGAHTTVAGTIYAPRGEISLGRKGRHTGAFVGRTVKVGRRVKIQGASNFPL